MLMYSWIFIWNLLWVMINIFYWIKEEDYLEKYLLCQISAFFKSRLQTYWFTNVNMTYIFSDLKCGYYNLMYIIQMNKRIISSLVKWFPSHCLRIWCDLLHSVKTKEKNVYTLFKKFPACNTSRRNFLREVLSVSRPQTVFKRWMFGRIMASWELKSPTSNIASSRQRKAGSCIKRR